jgi:Ca2+-binding EF-hand superfamily protein
LHQARLSSGPAGLRRAFKIFDRDGSGGITRKEFTQVRRLLPTPADSMTSPTDFLN